LQTNAGPWTKRIWIARRILAKKIFSALGSVNRFFHRDEQYGIRAGYHHALTVLAFDDRLNTDEWQKEVYQLAAQIMVKRNYQSVIDIGCGSAYKLIHYLGGFKTTGIEVEPGYSWLKEKYPERNWLLSNHFKPAELEADLIICSDTIEHIRNPDEIVQSILAMKSKLIIFSTPERSAVAGQNDYGPPENPSHYREWNAPEFKKWLSQWFDIEEQRIFKDRSTTQVIICKK